MMRRGLDLEGIWEKSTGFEDAMKRREIRRGGRVLRIGKGKGRVEYFTWCAAKDQITFSAARC